MSSMCDSAPTQGTDSSALLASSLERSKRGPEYSNVEDVIVSKAFIAASENALCGAHQKGKVFKAHMFDIYVALIKEQIASDKVVLEQSSQSTQEEYASKGVGTIYPERSADSIYNRFKGQIAPEVMKYMGIDETTDMGSGWSPDDHKTACLESFKQRYGHSFDFFSVYLYLKDKNKFSSFCTKVEEELRGSRPMGKKKARQAEADAKLIKSVISEVVVKQERPNSKSGGDTVSSGSATSLDGVGMSDVFQNISNVVASVGNAILENMQSEQDMRIAQSLDTPDRKAFAKEQMALRMAESRDKRRRLETRMNLLDENNEHTNGGTSS
jgi:hypothetical protein